MAVRDADKARSGETGGRSEPDRTDRENRRQVAAGQFRHSSGPSRCDSGCPDSASGGWLSRVAEFALTWAMVQFSGSTESRTPCGWMAPGMWIGSRSQASRSPVGCGSLNPMTQGMSVSWLLVRSFFAASGQPLSSNRGPSRSKRLPTLSLVIESGVTIGVVHSLVTNIPTE